MVCQGVFSHDDISDTIALVVAMATCWQEQKFEELPGRPGHPGRA